MVALRTATLLFSGKGETSGPLRQTRSEEVFCHGLPLLFLLSILWHNPGASLHDFSA